MTMLFLLCLTLGMSMASIYAVEDNLLDLLHVHIFDQMQIQIDEANMRGDFDQVKKIIGKMADLYISEGLDVTECQSKIDNENDEHLILFTVGNVLEGVREALDNGANPNVEYKKGWTALHFACRIGNLEIVKELIKTANINIHAQNDDGFTSLHVAANCRHYEIIQTLINHKADSSSGDKDVVIDDAANGINIKDNKGSTALHLLAMAKDPDYKDELLNAIKALLDKGALVNALNHNMLTALHYAAFNGNIDAAKILLSYGADDSLKTQKTGSTAADIARAEGHTWL